MRLINGARRFSVIERPRVSRCLAGVARLPLRLLCAPVGSGATTALQEYARRRGVVYVTALPGHGREKIEEMLRRNNDAHEVLIDGADQLAPDGFDALLQHAVESGSPRLLLAGHARNHLRVHTLVARGEAELLDASVLAFDAAEIAALARALGLDAQSEDVEHVLHATEGWAVAVSWTLRDASRAGRSLCGAFDIWAEANGHLVLEFIEASVGADAEPDAFATVLAASSYDHVQPVLLRLEAHGYPIARSRQGLRPYRLLRRIAAPAEHVPSDESDAPLALTLFGRFSCRAGGRDVGFVRRRDQNVLVYLALSPLGRVARTELAETFWPDVPAAIASQGVRSTLSRLRRAIACASGRNADWYLRTGVIVALDLERVIVDARRFAEHAKQGIAAEERGDYDEARRHYVLAERLRTGDLLRSEAIEPLLEPVLARHAQFAAHVADRLVSMRRLQHEHDAASVRSFSLEAVQA